MEKNVKSYKLDESIAFQEALDRLRKVFEIFGFIPHSTSVFADISEMRKQTDLEIFQVINPLDQDGNLGLRVDHTIPLMSFLEKHHQGLVSPFRRYTAQKVFRPQKEGGYAEYHACDIDIIGTSRMSNIYDAEIIATVYQALTELGFKAEPTDGDDSNPRDFSISINSRPFINELLLDCNIPEENLKSFKKALAVRDTDAIVSMMTPEWSRIAPFLEHLTYVEENQGKVLRRLREECCRGKDAIKALDDLTEVYHRAIEMGVDPSVLFVDPLQIRNMEYYSGLTITANAHGESNSFNPICYGGRYKIQLSDKTELTGCGVSFPLTSLFSVYLWPKNDQKGVKTVAPIMVSGIQSPGTAIKIASHLRRIKVKTEMVLNGMSLEKQIDYAKSRGFKIFLWVDEDNGNELNDETVVNVRYLQMKGSGAFPFKALLPNIRSFLKV